MTTWPFSSPSLTVFSAILHLFHTVDAALCASLHDRVCTVLVSCTNHHAFSILCVILCTIHSCFGSQLLKHTPVSVNAAAHCVLFV